MKIIRELIDFSKENTAEQNITFFGLAIAVVAVLIFAAVLLIIKLL